MKKILLSISIVLAIIAAAEISHLIYLYNHCESYPTDFYHPKLIQKTAAATVPNPEEKQAIRRILDQDYLYLKKGRQMTAYISKDGQYVIKFFNPRTFVRKAWFSDWKRLRHMASLKWISKAYFKRAERLQRLSYRHQLAFDELKAESGLVYVHLNPSTQPSQNLHVFDREGKSHYLDLDSVPFVIQKKATLVFTAFDALQSKGEIEQIKEGILQLYDLFLSRAQKGITDRLQTLHNNYGLLNGKAIQIDLGGIQIDEKVKKNPHQEVARVFSNLAAPICMRYPEVAPFVQELSEKIPLGKVDRTPN